MNELFLIDQAIKGDVESFEQLISPYTKQLLNYTFRMLKNREDAEDALQDTYIKVYNSLKSFQGNSSFRTWLYKIATNVCLDHLRKEKNASNVSLNQTTPDGEYEFQVPDDTYSPEIAAKKKAAFRALNAAMNNLEHDQRQAVSLRDIHGFSYDEIAQVTDTTIGTVKSRINRARQALRKILEKDRELFL
ncbi:MAG: sigma-70 family RNA polymerase sigma factor [Clostridia bacterium]|nr:sigma-70 family RNA polymerase sigma factor [Clostridia bacterium]